MNTSFKSCTFCGSKHLGELFEFKHAYLVKCKSCFLVFSKRIPISDELAKHYQNYPRYTELSPITLKRYNELLDYFEKFRQTNNLIDLGCSNGLFLEVAKSRGWNVFGTEYDESCIVWGKNNGIPIYKSTNLPEQLFQTSFDIVTSFEVIEHVNTPNEEVQLIYKLLRKGGLAYVTTPNFNSFSRFYLRGKWNVVEYPEHLTYFTPRTLKKVFSSHNFETEMVLTTGIAISRMRKSLGKVETSNLKEKNSDEQLREKIEASGFLLKVKSLLNFLLNKLKIGDAMKAYFIKK